MRRVLIAGAAGRDFHNFNICFRHSSSHEVVAFTATQIPGIEGRLYPPELAGSQYPKGIPIYSESDLPSLVRDQGVQVVTLAYSDISYDELGKKASLALSLGADFLLISPERTMLSSRVPVVSVCGVRTGVGKSTVTRSVSKIIRRSKKLVVVRHPMPYGDLAEQEVQRFESIADLDRHHCSIEEREEYEPHLRRGNIVYAGIDYEKILDQASAEADVIIWDGGNNDLPFFRPSYHIVVADPWRAGDETRYYPSEINIRMADLLVVNKVDTAEPQRVKRVQENLTRLNPGAQIILASSNVTVSDPGMIKGRRVLVVEDGPTVTHGEMPHSAGFIAAKKFGAGEIVDPRPHSVGVIKETYEKYPHLGPVLPTIGYGESHVRAILETISRCKFDVIVSATPADLTRIMRLDVPLVPVEYDIDQAAASQIEEALNKKGLG